MIDSEEGSVRLSDSFSNITLSCRFTPKQPSAMVIQPENIDLLKAWLKSCLVVSYGWGSDCDNLTKYVVALVRKAKTTDDLKKQCGDNLQVSFMFPRRMALMLSRKYTPDIEQIPQIAYFVRGFFFDCPISPTDSEVVLTRRIFTIWFQVFFNDNTQKFIAELCACIECKSYMQPYGSATAAQVDKLEDVAFIVDKKPDPMLKERERSRSRSPRRKSRSPKRSRSPPSRRFR